MPRPTTLDGSAHSPRSTLVAELRRRLDRETFPRIIVLLMVVVAGIATFVCSAIVLAMGFESMAARYALATASGYVVFLLLIRMWIAVRRGWFPDDDCGLGDPLLEASGSAARSAGSGLFDATSHGFGWSFDFDDGWWLALVVLAAGAGLVTLALVVYWAPILLAEVALDAALVGTVYRRLRREDRRYWATTALRETWVSAAVMVTFMGVFGLALQHLSPEAVSIGDVVRRLFPR